MGKNIIVRFCMDLWSYHISIANFGWYSLTIFLPTVTQSYCTVTSGIGDRVEPREILGNHSIFKMQMLRQCASRCGAPVNQPGFKNHPMLSRSHCTSGDNKDSSRLDSSIPWVRSPCWWPIMSGFKTSQWLLRLFLYAGNIY